LALWLLCCAPPLPPHTATPPPARPRLLLRQAVTPQDIIGDWVDFRCWLGAADVGVTRDGYWYQFREDGAYRVAFQPDPSSDSRVQALRALEAAPLYEGVYWFAGDKLHLKMTKSAQPPPLDCAETESVYEVRVAELLGQISIKLYEIAEPCEMRASHLELVYLRYR
jgi:hypothetical protein